MRPLRAGMATLRRQPVRTRLAIFSGVLTAVILIAFAAVVGRLVINRIEADFRDDVRGTTNGLAVALASRPVSGSQLAQLATANDAFIRIVKPDGEIVSTTPGTPDFGPPTDEIQAVGSVRYASQFVRANVLSQGPVFVQYGQSRGDVDATTDRLLLFLAGGVLIGTLLAAVAGMSVASRAMRPIAALTGTARDIARTRDPSMRIPEPESNDEVAELSRTLEMMLRELDAARTETESTIRRQREFVADASHELRTPLTSILANLELLEASLRGTEDEDEQAAARSALRSSKRMSRLVADLLILARADAGRRGEPTDCDLSRIAVEAVDEVRPVAEGHAITADVDPDACLSGDADELHRMILNLLENAVRHTPEGTSIDLELRRDDETAGIVVSDDGPGLPEGMDAQVFERFVRGPGPADSHRANGDGTGLGLSIVRAVAVAHGGEVEAGASASGGARFSVVLPVDRD